MYESLTHTPTQRVPESFEPPVRPDQAIFPIERDETLGRLVAMFLHNRLFGAAASNGGSRADGLLRQLGWPDELVREIGEMPINDIAKILGGSSSCMGVVFDARKAAAVVNSYRALRQDERDLEFFILNGATPALIRTLFPKVSARVVGQMRKRLGCESRGGRPPVPDAPTTYAIYRCWKTLCAQESNPRTRYMRLKEEFPACSLATLCTALETN